MSAYSSVASGATTELNPGTGLVAAYGFNEGSGGAVGDASGNSNNGTLTSGVNWTTQGKFGNALVFNGSSGRVDIFDAPNLRLTTAMTLEAWVNPATASGWLARYRLQGQRQLLPHGNSSVGAACRRVA